MCLASVMNCQLAPPPFHAYLFDSVAIKAQRSCHEFAKPWPCMEHDDEKLERACKVARLGRKSFVSQSGIAALISQLRSEGVPKGTSRRAQYRARKVVCHQQTEFGPLVQEVEAVGKDGKVILVPIKTPLAAFACNVKTSKQFSDLVRKALADKPASPHDPWRIIMYQDGVDPSDGLSKNHSRKATVFYWSFLELGVAALGHEEVWMMPCVLRTSEVNKLDGGSIQLTDIVLGQFFSADGHDVRRAGLSFTFHGSEERATIFAKLGMILGDEPALKEMLGNKGHAGTKCCILCMNVVQHNSPGSPLCAEHLAALPFRHLGITQIILATTDGVKDYSTTKGMIWPSINWSNGYSASTPYPH